MATLRAARHISVTVRDENVDFARIKREGMAGGSGPFSLDDGKMPRSADRRPGADAIAKICGKFAPCFSGKCRAFDASSLIFRRTRIPRLRQRVWRQCPIA
jgi:hypothetical protein